MTPRTSTELGRDPHAASWARVVAAYGRAASYWAPQILLHHRLPRAVVKRLAWARLVRAIHHARRAVPFYRARYGGLATPRDRADLAAYPLLSKADLREAGDSLLRDGAPSRDRLSERSSSGSSGRPVRVLFDPLAELPRRLQELRLLSAHGFRLTDRQVIFDAPSHMPPRPFLLQRLGLWRRDPFPWERPLAESLRWLEGERVEVLHGVLSSVRMLALSVRKRGGLAYRPKLVVTKGELLDPGTRRLVEDTFGCPLVDYYATEEVGIIAWQEPGAQSYLVDEDLVFVEIVDERGQPVPDGQVGEIVVSNLYQRTMPILRYRTGDLGRLSPERTPWGLPRLEELRGRRIDCLVTPDGRVRHPFTLMAALEDVPEIEAFRLEQTAVDELTAWVRWEPAGREPPAARVVERLSAVLGDGMQVRVRSMPEDERFEPGKSHLVKVLPERSVDALRLGDLEIQL